MELKLYCELYVSECWREKKEKLISRLKKNRLQPRVYLITLAQGGQNHLEFFSSVLLKQHVFDSRELFLVGIADGYDECLAMTEEIAGLVCRRTGGTDIRGYILARQDEFEKTGR
ncbi:MAG TPA: hypothetical protein H9799_04510 [Candidatus Mediterraneibacter merdipullorum]|nr:hypothetical protein [Candidatus Mediterraneibacter merdipullorum]